MWRFFLGEGGVGGGGGLGSEHTKKKDIWYWLRGGPEPPVTKTYQCFGELVNVQSVLPFQRHTLMQEPSLPT